MFDLSFIPTVDSNNNMNVDRGLDDVLAAFFDIEQTRHWERELESKFPNVTKNILDPDSPNYAWRWMPSEPIKAVSVPIDNYGSFANFKQFIPSKWRESHVDQLLKRWHMDWDKLNQEIWVNINFLYFL